MIRPVVQPSKEINYFILIEKMLPILFTEYHQIYESTLVTLGYIYLPMFLHLDFIFKFARLGISIFEKSTNNS